MIRVLRILVAILFLVGPCALAQQIEIKGRRLSVHAPAGDEPTARRLTEAGDKALERYAADLGVAIPPKLHFRIFVYGTKEEYEVEEEKRTHGRFKTNLAFTHAKNAEVHMFFQPRPGRGEAQDGPGMLEALAMHELSHALQYAAVPHYAGQPDWLSEGFADLCAERADAAGESGLEKLPYFAQFHRDVETALFEGKFVPIERLVSDRFGDTSAYRDRQIWYGEAWTLVRFLDAPDAPPRREKFRAFMKEIQGFAPGEDYSERVNLRFRELFGVPTKGDQLPTLAPLEREWLASMRKAKPFPWYVISRDVRQRADGALVVEALPENSAFAISMADAPLGPRAQINATFTIEDGPGKQADVILAYRGRDEYHKVAMCASGYVTLFRNNGAWQRLMNLKCAPELVAPGVPHTVEVIVDVGRLAVKIDGNIVLRYTVPNDGTNFGGGRFGVGSYDSKASFSGVKGASF